jgi:hypothetical protein
LFSGKRKSSTFELYSKDHPTGSTVVDRRAHEKRCDDVLSASCLMLDSMSPDLQK